MPKQDDEIFEFDPNSFWGEREKKQNIDYVRVDNKETGMIAMVSTSTLETQNKQQVLTQIDEFYQQYNVFRTNLKPEEIKRTAQWFKENYQLLNLIARQVVFHLIKLYEHRVKIHLTKTGKLHSSLPTFTLDFDPEGNLLSVKLHLSQKRIDQIIEQLETDITVELKNFQIIETAAEEFLTFHSISLVARMQQNIGIEAFNSMNPNEREKAFHQYFQEQEPRDLESKVVDFLKHFSQRNATAIFKTLEALPLTELERTFGFRENEIAKPVPVTESRLTNAISNITLVILVILNCFP